MKAVYFILGMHRSGTSALAGCLNHMGLESGSSLMVADEGNEKGYFENTYIYEINKTILLENNSNWDDCYFDVNSISKNNKNKYLKSIKNIIEKEFRYSEKFYIKDPRICLLFPLWEQACLDLGIEINVIIPYRNPLEIALSLNKRNNFSFEKSLILWLHYFLTAEFLSRNYHRTFLSFNSLLNETTKALEILSSFAELTINENIESEIYDFLDVKIKHNNKSLDNFTREAPSFLRNVISFMKKADFQDKDGLDKIRADFYYSLELFQNGEIRLALKDSHSKETTIENLTAQQIKNEKELQDNKLEIQRNQLKFKQIEGQFEKVELENVKQLNNLKQKQQLAIQNLEKEKEQILKGKVQELINVESSFSSKIQDLELINSQSNKSIQNIEVVKAELDTRVQGLEIVKNQLKTKIEDLEAINSQLGAKIQGLETVNNELGISIQNLEIENKNLAIELDKKVYSHKSTEHELNTTILTLEKEITKSEKALAVGESENNHLLSKISILEKDNETASNELTTLSAGNLNEKQLIKQHLESLKVRIKGKLKQYKQSWKSDHNQLNKIKKKAVFNLELFHTLFIQYTRSLEKERAGLNEEISNIKPGISNNLKAKSFYRLLMRVQALECKVKGVENKFNRVPFKFVENFNQDEYLEQNEDVQYAINKGDFATALEHFILFGFDEVFQGNRKLYLGAPIYHSEPLNRNKEMASFEFGKFLEGCHPKVPQNSFDLKLEELEKMDDIVVIHNEDKYLEYKNTSKTLKPQQTALIDIILPVYNALEDVKNCINSLFEHKSREFNLIVIDDCSDQETAKYLEKESLKKGFQLLQNKQNLRFTKTVNRGLKESTSDYVVLLNSDTIVTPLWLEKIQACFNSDSKIGIVGPLSNAASWQTVPQRNDEVSGGWLVNEMPEGYSIDEMGVLIETISKKHYPRVPSVNGFCYVIKRDVLNQIGMLDEEYFPTGYGEEDDFSLRAKDAGFEIAVADDTYIYHAKSKSYTHEIREVLTKGGRKSLDKKHGANKISQLVKDWKSEKVLPKICKHIQSYMQISGRNKKVVYTAIFGNYDSIKEPEYINKDWDYICFTDNANLKSKTFTIRNVEAIFENTTKNARMIKILSHIFFINYDYSLWIDGNAMLRGENIEKLVQNNKSDEFITLHQHVKRNCVYTEAKACIAASKDNSILIQEQIAKYKQEGYPEKNGLVETAEILRQQKNKKTKSLNQSWWNELNNHSIRDQLAFNYVCWKNDFNYSLMKGIQWLDPHFNIYQHGTQKTLKKQPKVAVIIVLEDNNLPKQRLNHLISITKYDNYELILVNINSDTGFIKKLNEFQNQHSSVSVFNLTGKSVQEAKNQIGMSLETDLLCFLDENTQVIESNWLSLLVSEMIFNRQTAIVGPCILDKDYKIISGSVRVNQKDNGYSEASDRRLLNGTGPVFALSEKCTLITKQIFLTMDGFDCEFDSRNAVTDMCFRILHSGLNPRFVLNSQIIDLSSVQTEKAQEKNSHLLRRKWGHVDLNKIRHQNLKSLELKIVYFPERKSDKTIAGSGYIRTALPMSKILPSEKLSVKEVSSLNDFQAEQTDIVFVQRTSISKQDIEKLKLLQETTHLKIIYEIDDDLIKHFTDSNNLEKVAIVTSMLKLSDHVIVSTNELKSRYLEHNSQISVIENTLDLNLWNQKKQAVDSEIKLLYMGTESHLNDLKMIEKDLIRIKEEFKNVTIDFIGVGDGDYLKKIGNVIKLPSNVSGNYRNFVKWISENNQWHIGIAPLEENYFNKTKSHIKFLDYTAIGLAAVCSNVEAYNSTIENNITGLLVNNKSENWYNTIKDLINNKHKIDLLRNNAYKKLTSSYDLNKNYKEWLSIFKK